MQYRTTTGWLVALALHLLEASTLRVLRSDLSATNDVAPPYIEQLNHKGDSSLIENTRVHLENNTCTPYSSNKLAYLHFAIGANEYRLGGLNVQFDIFGDAICSKPSLLETLWQTEPGTSEKMSSVDDDLRARFLRMKSVRARSGRPDDDEGTPVAAAGWNETAVWCEESLEECMRRAGTPEDSMVKRQEILIPGILVQYTTDDCSGQMSVDNDNAHPVNGRVTSPSGNLYDSGDCIAWYPILDQEHGPSIGVDFGSEGYDYVQHVDFFKSNPACEADEKKSSLEGDAASSSCCDKSAGGFLGTINSDGIANDFGATKQLDPPYSSGICAQIGVGQNQTLWDTRYFSMTFGA